MQTEQDTFNRLKRMPFEQMRQIVRELNRTRQDRRVSKAINDSGWNVMEYHKALAKAINE